MRGVAVGLATGLLLATTLAGCGDDAPRQAAGSPTRSAPTDPERPSTGDGPGPSRSGQPSLEADPADPRRALLDWRRVPGPVSDAVTVSGRWSLRLPQGASRATLDGPRPTTVVAPRRHRITAALIDGEYAVVVAEDELAQEPDTATVLDLASGERFEVDGGSDVPTTTGGTWALGEGRLLHATIGPDRAYCLASVDLATHESTRSWCAPKRHGFNDARVTAAGTSLLTFDDQRPSCRTIVEVRDDEVVPFAGVPECTGWDALVVDGGSVWSVVPRANRVEEADFHARVGDETYDLGPGTSGSLTWCGDAAYFVRDPQHDGDPARLMSWDPGSGLTVAYETRGGGQAFLGEPRCGGDTIAVTALARSGDVQVTAPVG